MSAIFWLVIGYAGGLVTAYLAPKLWAKLTRKTWKVIDKIKD